MHEKKSISLPSHLFVPVFLLILSSPVLALEAADRTAVLVFTLMSVVLPVIGRLPPVPPG